MAEKILGTFGTNVFYLPFVTFLPASPFPWPGNVWEWCQDNCDYSGGVVIDTYLDGIVDPFCTGVSRRVDLGGIWRGNERYCRSAHRSRGTPGNVVSSLGLRLARAQ